MKETLLANERNINREEDSGGVKLKEDKITHLSKEISCYEVNPLTINQEIFKEPRRNLTQEWVRETILEAFKKLEEDSKYTRPFKIIVPEKTWGNKKVSDIIELSGELGEHITDWVEQALEWAQRISNGEKWESICNKPDTANWYRLVIWKNGFPKIVGGSRKHFNFVSPCTICGYGCNLNIYNLSFTVPSVVVY